MDGDWIPISVDLPGKPEVARLAALTERSPDEVVGLLVRFWAWAQAQTADGTFPGMDCRMIAAVSHVPLWFLERLAEVGWLTIRSDGLAIPGFDRWLSGGAKRRLKKRDQARRSRGQSVVIERPQNVHSMRAVRGQSVVIERPHDCHNVRTTRAKQTQSTFTSDENAIETPPRSPDGPEPATSSASASTPTPCVSTEAVQCEAGCGQSVDNLWSSNDHKMTTREEIYIERDNNIPPRFPPRERGGKPDVDFSRVQFPEGCDTPEVRAAIADWLAYRRRIGKPFKDPQGQVALLLKRFGRTIVEAVPYSIAQGFIGCYAPGPKDTRTNKGNDPAYVYDPSFKYETF